MLVVLTSRISICLPHMIIVNELVVEFNRFYVDKLGHAVSSSSRPNQLFFTLPNGTLGSETLFTITIPDSTNSYNLWAFSRY